MPMPSIVLLARHGETEWNVARRPQGRLDSPLTERGREHAEALARIADHVKVDAIFTSPLGRAAATAARCGDRTGLPVQIIEELAELDHGRMAGLTVEQAEIHFPGEWARRRNDKYGWRFPGGESYADADLRAAHAVSRVSGQRALVVAHEMIGRMVARHLLSISPSEALLRSQPNEVVYRIDTRTGVEQELRTTDLVKP